MPQLSTHSYHLRGGSLVPRPSRSRCLPRFSCCAGPKTKRAYPLRGRVRCGYCTRRMEGTPRESRAYYRCAAPTLVSVTARTNSSCQIKILNARTDTERTSRNTPLAVYRTKWLPLVTKSRCSPRPQGPYEWSMIIRLLERRKIGKFTSSNYDRRSREEIRDAGFH
jgi:recombinase-like zinc beta ribbon protein